MISTLAKKSKLLLFGLVLLSPLFTMAQSSVVLSVSPTLFEMTANKGQTWSSSVRVINANPFPLTVYAEPVNFQPTGEAGQGSLIPVFAEETQGSTLAEWIDIEQEEIIIPPEQTMNVPFTITVPPDAAPGGHFAAVLVGTRPPAGLPGVSSVETSQVVSSLVFLRVAGDITESGSIREFVTNKAVYESADATFSVRFANTGNVHIQPQGEIEITNMWGQDKGVVPINKNSQFGNVLPDSTRTYNFQWSADWTLADIGRHKAVVTLAYGEQSRQFADATTYFWVIPWKLLLLTAVVLGGLLALIVWGIKVYIRRMLQLAGVTPELQRSAASKRVSVTAPIEEGILDLRSELSDGQGSLLARLWAFALAYRAFMVVAAAVVVFIGLLIWYVVLVVTNDFNYEVRYEQPDGSTIPLETDTAAPADATEGRIPIAVVNHTGDSTAVEQIERIFDLQTYQIVEQFEQYDGVKERTVLIYDPAFTEEVTQIQSVLPDVLISAYTPEDEDAPPFVLYIGTDLLTQ